MTEDQQRYSKDSSRFGRSASYSRSQSLKKKSYLAAQKDRLKSRSKLKKEKPKRQKKPKEKMMPFVPQLAESVAAGRTIFTFRYKNYPFYPKTGERFRANCDRTPLPGIYECRRRIKSSIGEVKEKHWKNIGVASPEAYEELMKSILKTQTLNYDKVGYLYVFDRVE